ncbi:putative ABC transporter permease [Ihubacter massiliensis]|uniref:ABC transporter permease n=1 Tax=Hominibacterium faecale TaxID=2839743 RepID=A0A9J6QU72_9FIRM|nr:MULTISPECIES: hypothetical protein [Eubacteriales Family XIII. Incertae Sedis]MCI7304280.1 putative ABC transporter permease [Clostridia bacterium]MDE8731611.1 hypothetical protein [Eubacteriales bacterium DFI.9.88]MDY3010979.1 hypothetical protein [Clostridiales Family XIII bacterium]MCO7122877.1 putative ABC transporter permease [Ihubacter massiliensis]MCU7377150.1 putative ABC transporter permease [Hominibacterium faecale]
MSIFIFTVGALGYGALEVLFRGFTHWTMMLTGGACLLTLYYLNLQFHKAPLMLKAACGALVITLYEFAVGLIVNLWYHWNIWDYSQMPGNVLGQICPLFTLIWFFLCLGILLISKGLYYGYRFFRP